MAVAKISQPSGTCAGLQAGTHGPRRTEIRWPEGAMTSILMAAAVMVDDVGYFGKEIWTSNMLANPANYWMHLR